MTGLSAGEVHVWTISLAASEEDAARAGADLAPEEGARARRFLMPEDRRRFALSHAALRRILAGYLGGEAGRLEFAQGPHGKPCLAGRDASWLRFNLSHSRDAALVACARDHEVGADIEWMREGVDADGIVERYFSPEERREWEGLPPERRREAFFRGWTQKEAYVKGLGRGLSHPPEAYTVRLDPLAPAGLIADSLRPQARLEWSLHAVGAPPGYAAAIAVAGPAPRVCPRIWPPP